MYNEKRRPHYDLRAFQAAFARPGGVRITRVASESALELGFLPTGVAAVVELMRPCDFYKAMTSNQDSRIWQDVYHVPFADIVLYVKFCSGVLCEFTLLSFKEK